MSTMAGSRSAEDGNWQLNLGPPHEWELGIQSGSFLWVAGPPALGPSPAVEWLCINRRLELGVELGVEFRHVDMGNRSTNALSKLLCLDQPPTLEF